jgi:hypothetical protein
MALVNNATGVYATLGYNFDDPNGDILQLSANTVAHLNSMPAFIESWQAKDIADNNVGGYYQNPVAANTNIIITSAGSIVSIYDSSNGIIGLETIYTEANTLQLTATNFLEHTNRISGVTPFVGQDVENPYYDTAMGIGKTALYITNQTDNITNTSPILGSFTSILIGPQVGQSASQIQNYVILIQNSLNTEEIIDEGGNTITTTTSNLTPSQISDIETGLLNTNTLLYDRQTGDVTYYTNLRAFVDKYNTTKKFSNMGETETYLVNNFVGTDKIKERINS